MIDAVIRVGLWSPGCFTDIVVRGQSILRPDIGHTHPFITLARITVPVSNATGVVYAVIRIRTSLSGTRYLTYVVVRWQAVLCADIIDAYPFVTLSGVAIAVAQPTRIVDTIVWIGLRPADLTHIIMGGQTILRAYVIDTDETSRTLPWVTIPLAGPAVVVHTVIRVGIGLCVTVECPNARDIILLEMLMAERARTEVAVHDSVLIPSMLIRMPQPHNMPKLMQQHAPNLIGISHGLTLCIDVDPCPLVPIFRSARISERSISRTDLIRISENDHDDWVY